jgi:acyl-CoA reductase-like NAD-dependent aldehyde dehydrogenase
MATYEQSLLIGGQWMPADSGKTYECMKAFTGKAATRAAAASVGDVARTVSAAQDAFGAWAALPPSKRRQYMLAAADAIEARLPELSEAMTSEMGGPAARAYTM